MRVEAMSLFKCGTCGKEVRDGETYWSINLHKETLEEDAITVDEADMIGGYCSRVCLLSSGYDLPSWMLE